MSEAMHQLVATKSLKVLHEQESSGNQLRRVLGWGHLTLLGIGGIIGTGIFVLTGTAAANYAGPALPLSFIVAGIGCTLAAVCYAEFAAMIPVMGSAYAYSYATLGEGIVRSARHDIRGGRIVLLPGYRLLPYASGPRNRRFLC